LSEFPKKAEVVVIGAGIAGTMTAYQLAKRGVPVVLCEKGRVAGEQSSRNWGWIRKQGRDPREIPAIIESLRIWETLEKEIEADVGWQKGGTLYIAKTDEDLAYFERWLGFARDYQLDSRILSPDEVDQQTGSEGRKWKGGIFTPSDGRAEPAKAAPAVAKAFERLGGTVLTECAVRTVESAAGKVTGVVTEKGTIACQAVVCAAGAWTSYFAGNLGHTFPQLKVRASVLRTKPAPLFTQSSVSSPGAAIRRRQDGGYTIARSGGSLFQLVPDAVKHFPSYIPALKTSMRPKLRFGAEFFKELVRPRRWNGDQVTEFEKNRVLNPTPDPDTLREVLAQAQENFPQLGPLEVAETWAGMIEVTPDAIPIWSGVDDLEGFYIATGFSGHGFGMGAATGLLMSELVMDGRARVDLEPFRFSRFTDGSKLELNAR